jgi:uncharacterized protein with PIN domain
MTRHRFAVDRMLGHLAKWLRLIGQDATYGPPLSGRALLRHARSERRTVLTRDRHAAQGPSGPPVVLIESDHFREQLRQVIHTFRIDPFAQIFTLCVRCNDPVVPTPRAEIEHLVPPYVFSTQERFVRCPRCQRVYWPATHAVRVRAELLALGYHRVPAE